MFLTPPSAPPSPQDVCGKAEHIARSALGDLFLDTPACNAHTTATDALWSGVPLLTLPGVSQASRVAASVLTAAGVPDLIAPTAAAYEQMAVSLAGGGGGGRGSGRGGAAAAAAASGSAPPPAFRGSAQLASLRARLATARTSPLFDTPRWTRNTEALYWAAWERYAAGQPPATFEGVDVAGPMLPLAAGP